MKTIIIAVAIFMMALSSCHQIHSGEIVDKIHNPARTYTYMTTMQIGKTTVPQWHTGYVHEEFILKVRGSIGKETVIETFHVNQDNFYCCEIGETFIDSVPCSSQKW